MERELKVGMHLIYIDADREERDALLIAIHGDPKGTAHYVPKLDEDGNVATGEDGGFVIDHEYKHWPCVNLVVVEKNQSAQDQYGRQTQKDGITSVVHWRDSSAHGFCWRFPGEEVIGSAAPTIS